MKILHLIYSLLVGGAESMLIDIVNAQVSLGYKVTVLIVNNLVDESLAAKFDSRVRIVRMNRRQGDKPLLMLVRLNFFVARMWPDIIHAHHHKFCRLVQVRKNRLLLTVHCKDTSMQYASRSNMVAITDTVRDDILNRVPDARVETIFNGLRTADIMFRGGDAPSAVFKIVQVGSLNVEAKGQDLLIEALGELKKRGRENFALTFIGAGKDEAMLRQLAARLGVAESVHFAGLMNRSVLYETLCGFDAMVHPSRSEGFGLTVAEGMAAGLPLILTRHDGPWEVAANGRLCHDFVKEDVNGLVDAILAVSDDYSHALAIAAEARKYVRRFDISNTVEAYGNFYRRIISSK